MEPDAPARASRRTRKATLALLVISHLVLAVVAGSVTRWGRSSAESQAPRRRALAQLAVGMEPGRARSGYGDAEFERDVRVVAGEDKGPLGDTLRLIRALRRLDSGDVEDLKRAAGICRRLDWPRCDAAGLVAMRKATRR